MANSVDEDTIEVKPEPGSKDQGDGDDSAHLGKVKNERTGSGSRSPSLPLAKIKSSQSSSSANSIKSDNTPLTPTDKKESEENLAGEVTLKMEPGQAPKLARSSAQKVPTKTAPLFDHLPDATDEAKTSFAVMEACTYGNKYLGYTEHAMECDCSEEWSPATKKNHACGEDSDCINRATKMECVGDCGCGSKCQNQRFQRRKYASVSVIKTEKKGYGLRANAVLRPNDFIFEYIGEVINETSFRRRMVQYDEEKIKHFYFMSLSKGEFVDATKKGNLGRFCNHSCNPNCYVDKWVVGDKLRMGIFAERNIRPGEELVFNYNVDRYGANPQPCYCGEPNCTGFIGGKTQTERATKLSNATIEALGIDDGDGWDTAVAKKPRKKKVGEEDEEYVDSVQPKSLDADGVTKVMAALMQCKEKWIAVKLLSRIQRCDDENVRNRVVKMHGYQILNSQLAAWKEDSNIVLQILDILEIFPRLTRNKIIDSKIEGTLAPLKDSDDEAVAKRATNLLEEWSKLEIAYRIPRKKRDPNEITTPQKAERERFERRESAQERKRSRSRSPSPARSPPRGPSNSTVPSGPRAGVPPRPNFHPPRPPPFHRPFNSLPKGWFQAVSEGKTYFYSQDGKTQWTRPTAPAAEPPPPPKQPSSQDVLASIINNIVSEKEKEREAKTATPASSQTPTGEKPKKEQKWRSYDEEKKKKLYENTLFPHISHVMNKYKNKIPRDDLKRFAKELAKKLVNSDFKAGKVEDPTKISEKHEMKVKKYCKDFFDKAAAKHKAYEKKKTEKKARREKAKSGAEPDLPTPNGMDSPDVKKEEESDEEDVKMSDDEDENENIGEHKSSPLTPTLNGDSLKRKRGEDKLEIKQAPDGSESPSKKLKSHSPPPPPPPPPGPPVETPTDSTHDSPMDMHLNQDTRFKSKSMAVVLASAQQDCDEEDTPMGDIKAEEAEEHAHLDGANAIITNGTAVKEVVAPRRSVNTAKLNGDYDSR
ncbi:MAG: hypothetical protein Q9160_001773 [Pyrenula sp. 1 TL-2023]